MSGQGVLDEAWRSLTGEAAAPRVELEGPTELLPSVFPVVELAVAAVGAALLAGAELQHARRAEAAAPPRVALETRHVACAIRSERYARLDGQPVGGGFAPLSQFFEAADGWIRLHANYPWHRERLLNVLKCEPTPESVARAVRRWPAVELETAVVEAGGCAAAVRTPAAWRAHPQGSRVAELPLVELRPVGERVADRPLPPPGPLPASGLRVLDLTRVIAGPVCTRTLAALGAEVLRIDAPHLPELPSQTLDTLVGKRSTRLDLRQAADRQAFEDLLADAHVVVTGYRPGALDAFGLEAEALAARRPGVVVVSLSAWGTLGPWAGRRGFDSLVQAASGIGVCEAEGGARPGALPAQLLDHATGYLAAAAALIGLSRRQRHGQGWDARLALARTAAWLLSQPTGTRLAGEALDPSPYLVELPGAVGRVTLVRPPGALDGVPLRWPSPPPRYAADPPHWTGGAAG